MIRPEQTAGDGGANVGGSNSGTITIGLTFEEHQTALKEREAELRNDLERAHEGEKAVLQLELSAIGNKLSDVEADYQRTLAELAEIKSKLARYDNQINELEKISAYDALDRGDRSIAHALFAALEQKAQARADDALEEAAEMAFQQGQIAEQEIRWLDAAEHFARAARLNPTYDTLIKAGEFLRRAGRSGEAIRFDEDLVALSKSEHGDADAKTAEAMNNLASSYRAMGRYRDAEPLFRQAIEIGEATIGVEHPSYAIRLNNLALLLRDMGRYRDAEPLYRQAIEIDEATIGMEHPGYATRLNNLAGLLKDMGRYRDAEPLYRQAIAIDEATIGVEHPGYATDLNNLAMLLKGMKRFDEAKPLYAQAIEIDLEKLGKDHPQSRRHARNYADLLRQHFPDDPALAGLEATFGPEIGT